MQQWYAESVPPPIRMLCDNCWIDDFYQNQVRVLEALQQEEEFQQQAPSCNVCSLMWVLPVLVSPGQSLRFSAFFFPWKKAEKSLLQDHCNWAIFWNSACPACVNLLMQFPSISLEVCRQLSQLSARILPRANVGARLCAVCVTCSESWVCIKNGGSSLYRKTKLGMLEWIRISRNKFQSHFFFQLGISMNQCSFQNGTKQLY